MKITITDLLIVFTAFALGCVFFALGRMDSPQDNYLPSPDEIQQRINERLAPDMRIRVDGNPKTETIDAWDYVLAEDHNQVEIDKARMRWAIPEIDLTKGAE